PIALAIPRVLQCVAPRGVLSSVRTTTCSISSSVILRGAPGRGSSYRPARRSRTNRVRHLPTVAGVARSRWATPLLSWPSAHASTMRARRASAGTERDRWARDSNSRRSSLFKISGALGRPVRMLPPYRARRIRLAICFSYFCYRTLVYRRVAYRTCLAQVEAHHKRIVGEESALPRYATVDGVGDYFVGVDHTACVRRASRVGEYVATLDARREHRINQISGLKSGSQSWPQVRQGGRVADAIRRCVRGAGGIEGPQRMHRRRLVRGHPGVKHAGDSDRRNHEDNGHDNQ